ncbi:3'(2'),5'-bisphosphate nucleotidase CysQ [Neogemmobacter tilapiae]|uniref:3'(2'),5'-bisphosphate nucleotidase CysQ n=1 Tax=Neogemmobacter tilapiae TaxID=875041 RepID=A0A918TN14_9RHOB|nr:3'(2'),5'-bisphosphate nucleotidase CysQ [Gemmobacter tilapiae]GHC53369.1 3'(2'),5'-bisphosphate nucleotidase CysQ [Gemmobacter tilapiae]
MPEADLALLLEAAEQAGRIAMRFWRAEPKFWEKPGLGPVSEADLAVNAALRETLRRARPDYGWLSEEDADDPARLATRRQFVLDPIDGTRAFLAGEENFAHALAVVDGGRVMAGVVHMPAKARTYAADAQSAATVNGQPMQPSAQVQADGARLLTTGAGMALEHWPGGVPDFKRSFRASLAYRLCLIGEGRYDAMLTFRPAWEWDIAAASLIAERAGASVSDAKGGALVFNRPDPRADGVVVSATRALQSEIVARHLGRAM